MRVRGASARCMLLTCATPPSYRRRTADNEDERKRIEGTNPNPRLPLVRYVGGTWRVGGLLALSRAFGDAYLKGSSQFEGVSMYGGADKYGSGFGE